MGKGVDRTILFSQCPSGDEGTESSNTSLDAQKKVEVELALMGERPSFTFSTLITG